MLQLVVVIFFWFTCARNCKIKSDERLSGCDNLFLLINIKTPARSRTQKTERDYFLYFFCSLFCFLTTMTLRVIIISQNRFFRTQPMLCRKKIGLFVPPSEQFIEPLKENITTKKKKQNKEHTHQCIL